MIDAIFGVAVGLTVLLIGWMVNWLATKPKFWWIRNFWLRWPLNLRKRSTPQERRRNKRLQKWHLLKKKFPQKYYSILRLCQRQKEDRSTGGLEGRDWIQPFIYVRDVRPFLKSNGLKDAIVDANSDKELIRRGYGPRNPNISKGKSCWEFAYWVFEDLNMLEND